MGNGQFLLHKPLPYMQAGDWPFLMDIKQHWGDDLRKFVFADYLEETGRGVWARLIRRMNGRDNDGNPVPTYAEYERRRKQVTCPILTHRPTLPEDRKRATADIVLSSFLDSDAVESNICNRPYIVNFMETGNGSTRLLWHKGFIVGVAVWHKQYEKPAIREILFSLIQYMPIRQGNLLRTERYTWESDYSRHNKLHGQLIYHEKEYLCFPKCVTLCPNVYLYNMRRVNYALDWPIMRLYNKGEYLPPMYFDPGELQGVNWNQ